MYVKEQSVSSSNSWVGGGGNFFMLITASSDTTIILYEKGSEVSRAENVKGGYFSDGIEFDKFVVESATTQTVKVGWIPRDKNARGGYERSQGDVDADISGSNYTALTDVSIATTAQGKICDTNPDTREVHIFTDEEIRVGDVDNKPTITSGIKIPAGTLIVLSTKAELWGYVSGAGTATISLSTLGV